jgi:hypothetical protein
MSKDGAVAAFIHLGNFKTRSKSSGLDASHVDAGNTYEGCVRHIQ